jgi:HPt (histidine-containing phosphotransfer) domain-containing protein
MQGDRDRCLAAGFDNYLAKPVRQSELQAVFDNVERPGPIAVDSVVDGLNEICGGDDEFARELATSFLDCAPRCLAGIDEALRSRDGRKLAEEAHGLKGISQTIGAREHASACAAIEDAARRGDLGLAATEVTRVGALWQRLRFTLEQIKN